MYAVPLPATYLAPQYQPTVAVLSSAGPYSPVQASPTRAIPCAELTSIKSVPSSRVHSVDLKPWMKAAEEFLMNTDFDVQLPPNTSNFSSRLVDLMAAMKKQSAGKGTIQALGDKIILSKLLQNLNMPQMPVLFETYTSVAEDDVHRFVDQLQISEDPDAFDIVVKPTHLSNGTGLLVLSKDRWEKDGYDANKLVQHMQKHLAKKAADSESEALKSLVPGFIVQPRYRSSIEFGLPIEMRVVTLWGKARLGVWWWGRKGIDAKWGRTAWLVRKPKFSDRLDKQDTWEVLHQHTGENPGFETAIQWLLRAMPEMAAAAEGIASAVGAPFLRSDFFVGSDKWGVRLNEVAYGSGCDLRRRLSPAATGYPCDLVDDGPVIGQILREGFAKCKRAAPDHFLGKLGASGAMYEVTSSAMKPQRRTPGIEVLQLPPEDRRVRLASETVNGMLQELDLPAVPLTRERCETASGPTAPAAQHKPAAIAGSRQPVQPVPRPSTPVYRTRAIVRVSASPMQRMPRSMLAIAPSALPVYAR